MDSPPEFYIQNLTVRSPSGREFRNIGRVRNAFGDLRLPASPLLSSDNIRIASLVAPLFLGGGALCLGLTCRSLRTGCKIGAATLLVSSPLAIWSRAIGKRLGVRLTPEQIAWRTQVDAVAGDDFLPGRVERSEIVSDDSYRSLPMVQREIFDAVAGEILAIPDWLHHLHAHWEGMQSGHERQVCQVVLARLKNQYQQMCASLPGEVETVANGDSTGLENPRAFLDTEMFATLGQTKALLWFVTRPFDEVRDGVGSLQLRLAEVAAPTK